MLAWAAVAPVAMAQPDSPQPVVITAGGQPAWALASSVSQPDVVQADTEGADRIEDLAAWVPGMQAQVADGGLTSSISLRGFAVSRFYINGLRDVNRLFVRDLATVAQVRILRGPDALAAGTNSPGGTVWFDGWLPDWQAQTRVTASAGGRAGWRLGLNSTGPLPGIAGDALAYRVVAQWQDGLSAPGAVRLQRHTALAAMAWRYAPDGLLTLEAEWQHNHQPFLFGTVVLDGQVRHGQLYASPQQQSQRSTGRQALHWQQGVALDGGGMLRLRGDIGAAQVQRDETLIGFFDIAPARRLRGYYTRYHDDALQHDARLGAQWQLQLAGIAHQLDLNWVRSQQRFVFDGVQNIGGFSVSVDNPDFSQVDAAALRMAARYRSERSTEQAWSLLDSMRLTDAWTLNLGVSQLRQAVEADRSRSGLRTAGQLLGRVWQMALAGRLAGGAMPYISHNQSLEPNRGTTRQGDWLPPQRAAQWEAGLRWAGAAGPSTHVAAYRILQHNLPTTDPLDRTALVTTGVRRVQGVEASAQQRLGAWRWQAQLAVQAAANLSKTATGQGDAFAGVAGRSAALRLDGPLPGRDAGDGGAAAWALPMLWLQWQAVGPRWADAENTLRLPGHALLAAGLHWQHGPVALHASLHNLFNRNHVATVTALDNVYQGTPRRLWLGVANRF